MSPNALRRMRQLEELEEVKDNVTSEDTVDHPQHYGGDTPHEVIKCLRAWGLESDAILWTVVCYIARADKKGNKLEDLKKAQWYLNYRITSLEKGE